MRITLVFGALAVMILTHSSLAAALPTGAMQASQPRPNIIQVDKRCGKGRHYVARHRNKAGHIVPGRCVRDARH